MVLMTSESKYHVAVSLPSLGITLEGVTGDLELAMELVHAAQERGLAGIIEAAPDDAEVTLSRTSDEGGGENERASS